MCLRNFLSFQMRFWIRKQLQRFLGCLNYIRQFYENQAKDVRILQKRLSKVMPWNHKMTTTVQIIKQKIQNLPRLHLPDMSLQLILETDASNDTWATVLLQKEWTQAGRSLYICFWLFYRYRIKISLIP
jgi:hypothetical protein